MTVHRRAIACFLTASALFDATAFAQPAPSGAAAPAPDPEAEKKKEEGRNHFQKGLLLFDEEAWDGALVEFARSRAIYPTRAATKNAALCLRHLKRFDEALDMFEALLKIANLPKEDRELGEREVKALRGFVGTVVITSAEAKATVVIDGRERGTTPAPPVRVAVGTHVVRVFKEGFEPFETRVEVAGSQSVAVLARLGRLAESGRLKVIEQSGKVLEVVVDNGVVGKTPWEGALAPGDHTVFLRGEGNLGTQPASVAVRINQVTPVTLGAEELAARLRVQPTPAGAIVAIDGVSLGGGLWEGRLRAGAHRIEVAAEGFLPQTREVLVGGEKNEIQAVTLERDPRSAIWSENRGQFFIEVDGAFGLTPSFGGDVAATCTGQCKSSLGIGFMAMGHAGYRFTSGLLLGLDAGYLYLGQSTTGRATTLQPVGVAANPGTVDDALRLSGALLGASAGVRLGSAFPITLRLGAGALIGSLKDHRTGKFTTVARAGKPAVTYALDATDSPTDVSFYLVPEARLGVKVSKRLELSAGVEALVLLALKQPVWTKAVNAGTDGQGAFADALAGKVMVVLVPGVGARIEF